MGAIYVYVSSLANWCSWFDAYWLMSPSRWTSLCLCSAFIGSCIVKVSQSYWLSLSLEIWNYMLWCKPLSSLDYENSCFLSRFQLASEFLPTNSHKIHVPHDTPYMFWCRLWKLNSCNNTYYLMYFWLLRLITLLTLSGSVILYCVMYVACVFFYHSASCMLLAFPLTASSENSKCLRNAFYVLYLSCQWIGWNLCDCIIFMFSCNIHLHSIVKQPDSANLYAHIVYCSFSLLIEIS
jgi:hypothetical protein